MSGRCLNHFRFHTSCQFQIYHKSSQQTISEKPILLCTDVYFFYNFVSSGWTNISLEGHWHFLLTIHFTSHLILRGFLECERVLLKWLVMHISKRTLLHCFDLDEGRQRKSLKRQQVITYCVVASVQVPVIAWPIKNRKILAHSH